MIVCVCSGMGEREIQIAIKKGCHSFACLRKQYNVANDCNLCAVYAKKIFNDTLNKYKECCLKQ